MMSNKQKIYDEYLESDLHESDLIIKLDNLQDKTIKSDGVIYTPWYVVSAMINIAKPTPSMSIIEPSCGHGAFLFGLLHYAKDNFELTGPTILDWFINNVTGVDISKNTITELKYTLSLFFKKHYQMDVLPESFTNIVCNDGLLFSSKEYDLAIGNPPYIRTKNLEESYLKMLREKYVSCNSGNVDIYYAFVEKYATCSNEMCFITPNGFIGNKSGKKLREILSESLVKLIDFKEHKVFQDAAVYTCIIKTKKMSVDIVEYSNDLIQQPTIKSRSDILLNTIVSGELIKTVYSGIATLCDKVFKVTLKNNKYFASIDKTQYEIEAGIVVPYLKLTKVKSNDFSGIDYMIYPYDLDKKIIPEDELKHKFPLTYMYLSLCKNKLAQRDKGKTKDYDSWYAYGRRQGLNKITSKKIIIIPGMIGNECLPIEVDISNLISTYGQLVFTSGFIVPNDSESGNKLLDDNFIQFVRKTGKPWPGKKENYYSITSTQLKSFSG
jgi:adenine-specific DNA-methyltransferase